MPFGFKKGDAYWIHQEFVILPWRKYKESLGTCYSSLKRMKNSFGNCYYAIRIISGSHSESVTPPLRKNSRSFANLQLDLKNIEKYLGTCSSTFKGIEWFRLESINLPWMIYHEFTWNIHPCGNILSPLINCCSILKELYGIRSDIAMLFYPQWNIGNSLGICYCTLRELSSTHQEPNS